MTSMEVCDDEQLLLTPRSVTNLPSEPKDFALTSPDNDERAEKLELPSFLAALVIEVLGYPVGLCALVVCQAWRQHAERIFQPELLELRSVCNCSAEYLELPPSTKSTISVAFSPDRRRFASTHGDHTVKVIDFASGSVVATLVGHPRTPWTVKFHPTEPDIVASGCLGFEARIWDTSTQQCLHRTEFDRAIISLSFHPAGEILAIAAGTSIYLWDYASGTAPRQEFTHAHPIRCLRFLPCRSAIIVGAANNNATSESERRAGTARITFQLMLCDFDLEAARQSTPRQYHGSNSSLHSLGEEDQQSRVGLPPPLLSPVLGDGRAISRRPRCVLRRALFYNDGGFDVSPDGRFLCSCAELWLPYEEEEEAEEEEEEEEHDSIESEVQPSSTRSWARPTPPPASSGRRASLVVAWPFRSSSSLTESPTTTRSASAAPATTENMSTGSSSSSSGSSSGSSSSCSSSSSSGSSQQQEESKKKKKKVSKEPQQESLVPWWKTIDADAKGPPRQLGAASSAPRRSWEAPRPPSSVIMSDEQPLTTAAAPTPRGRFKPHLVVVSLADYDDDAKMPATSEEGEEDGALLQATALDDHSFAGAAADAAGSDIVTSVKLSPTASLVLLGHSRGGDGTFGDGVPRVVSVVYRVGDMTRIDTRKEIGDDVNIARFHPVPGAGIVYGTKQGRICKMTPLAPPPLAPTSRVVQSLHDA